MTLKGNQVHKHIVIDFIQSGKLVRNTPLRGNDLTCPKKEFIFYMVIPIGEARRNWRRVQ
jgi:hypothetical protein